MAHASYIGVGGIFFGQSRTSYVGQKSFIFLGDLIDLMNVTNLAITDDYVLTKANEEQILYIKTNIDNYSRLFSFGANRFELEKTSSKNGFIFNPLEESDWKYWVIETTFINREPEFSLALSLSEIDLTDLFHGQYVGAMTTIGREVPGIQDRGLTTVNFFTDNRLHDLKVKKLSDSDISEIRSIYTSLKNFKVVKKDYEFVDKCLQGYTRIQDISKQSPFRLLSYFAIIEHLLTTNTGRNQNENSINQQLQRKISLLNNQFEKPIDITEYFTGSDSNTIETIVAKLYQYRNDIAHGNKSDFEKELSLLKNSKSRIPEFLKILVKRILLYSLTETELIKDLRESKKNSHQQNA